MNLEALKVFCDLVETESFTRAAQINEVTQSAVSQAITALEKHFKSLLVERSKKNFRLTQEGQILYDCSKEMLGTFAAMQSKLQEIQGILSGNINVATVYSIGLYDLPPYLKRFLKDTPTVNVHVEYRRSNEVYEEVLGNIVDLGLVAYPARDNRLQTVVFGEDRLVLVCPPHHPLAREKVIKLKTLNEQKFVAFEPDIPTRKAVDKMLKDRGVEVQTVMEFDNIETVKRAVEIDSGITILPEETVKEEVAKATLAAVPLEGKHTRELAVIYKKTKVLSPAMKRLIDLLKAPR